MGEQRRRYGEEVGSHASRLVLFYGSEVTHLRRGNERRLAVAVATVGVRSLAEELNYGRDVAIHGGNVEQRQGHALAWGVGSWNGGGGGRGRGRECGGGRR